MNEALKISYDLEHKGLEFYISSATKCANALVKRTLFSLAQEEIRHMMKIDEVYMALALGSKWPDQAYGAAAGDIEASIRDFFENAGKDLIGPDKESADIIKKAMEFEKKSYELYSGLRDKAAEAGEKSFYEALRSQESGHFAALENVYYYLMKSGDWFEKEESNVWGWMNL